MKSMFMKQYFKAPWGTGLKCISLICTLILGFVCLTVLPAGTSWAERLIRLLPWIILGSAACFTVRGYTFEGDVLRIHRLLWDTVIPLTWLKQAETLPHAMRGSLRTCGNGGLYSFTGYYWNKRLGHYRAYVTDLERTVVLRFTTRCIVISPDEPEEFVEAVKAAVTPP